jgi:hypothetical protein
MWPLCVAEAPPTVNLTCHGQTLNDEAKGSKVGSELLRGKRKGEI